MQQEIKTERNYGIDLLRMLSMFLVCILHILEQGGVIGASKALSAQYETAWFMDIAAFCAVNCFALISGYVCIDAKYKYSNGIMLYLKVIFYTLVITALFAIIKPDTVGAGDAFASGYLFGYVTGLPVKRCIQYGLACAKETLHTRQTVSEFLSPDFLESYPDFR